MVLPLLIVGGLGVGGATGYGMYQLGSSLALPSHRRPSPPPEGLGALSAGAMAAAATYSLQRRVLNRHLAHLLTYQVPADVAKWGARDFLRLAAPIVAPHAAMFASSLAAMGFVATKVAVMRSP